MNIATIASGFFMVVILGTGVQRAESFDKPLHKRVLDLGPSQYVMGRDNKHVTVTCSYYSRFMIKEEDDPGWKGAKVIALAPVLPGKLPECSEALQAGEREFKEWNSYSKTIAGWDGYFAGVKHDLVFLGRPEGDENSGMQFTVFESDAHTKLFTDSVMLSASGAMQLKFLSASGGQVIFRYLRVATDDCSIPKSGESCWRKLQDKTGLIHSRMPKCSDYEGKEAGLASVIAYPVEVSLYPKPSMRTLSGPAKCYPIE